MTKKSIENYLVYTFFIFARCFERAQNAKKSLILQALLHFRLTPCLILGLFVKINLNYIFVSV